jgi:hypothetical protein
MAGPYTQLFAHVSRATDGAVLAYQQPEGFRSIVRDILLNVVDTAPKSFSVYYVTGGVQYTLARVLVTDSQPYHLELRQVLPPGAELWVYGSGIQWTCVITGYELAE